MIYEALDEIADELNQHFKLRFGITEDKLFISTIVNNDGSDAIEKDNVIMHLVNIREEKLIANRHNSGGNPPVSLNLYILFTTNFSGKLISEGIKFISEIIGFFQSDNVIEAPGTKLIMELQNLDFQEQNSLWASLGAKYSPSVVYKARMVTIDEGMPTSTLIPPSEFPDKQGKRSKKPFGNLFEGKNESSDNDDNTEQ